ncbi:helix-turn-helix domain-containing protein [Pseudoclavibacter helvolus]|uniref:helix-turn-helix domain-containing protein n=1 Tax=Pseudoclavibacter helvolus TaxID=255205 RepID=UPI003C721005
MNKDLAARRAFGDRVRDLRQDRGWSSQEAFANHVDLDRTYVSAIERGRRNPTLEIIVRLARGLEVSPSELLSTIEIEAPAN